MSKFYIPNKATLPQQAFNSWIWDILDDYLARYEVYYGGGGSGKSYGAVQKVILKCVKNKRRVLVIRKVGNTIRDSIFLLFKTILNDFGIPFIENKSELNITLPNGSIFLFKGLDDPEKIKSITDITDIVIEEATELSQEDFTQLDIRLRPPKSVKYPQIYLMFNPISKANWCYLHWFANGTPPKATVTHSTYKDNEFLTADYIETLEALVHTNPAYYKIYCLGDFATLDKLVFPIIHKQIINQEEIKNLSLWAGLDFGYVNDPSALTWGRLDQRNKKLYITGEHDKKGMVNDEIAKVIINLGLSKEIIVADSAEQKSIEELRRLGIRGLDQQKKDQTALNMA